MRTWLMVLPLFALYYWLEGQRQRVAWRFRFASLAQELGPIAQGVTCLMNTLHHSNWWYV